MWRAPGKDLEEFFNVKLKESYEKLPKEDGLFVDKAALQAIPLKLRITDEALPLVNHINLIGAWSYAESLDAIGSLTPTEWVLEGGEIVLRKVKIKKGERG